MGEKRIPVYCEHCKEFRIQPERLTRCMACGGEFIKIALTDDEFIQLHILNKVPTSEILNKYAIVPKCPICGSKNLSKLSTADKIVKIGLFGIFGMGDNGKTYKCNDCGAKF